MLNMQQILFANGSAMLLLLIVLQSSYRMFDHNKLDSRLMNIMIMIALLQCILETTTFLIDGIVAPALYEVSILLNALTYIGNALFSFVSSMYVDYKLFGDIVRIKKRCIILMIPACIIIVGSLVNLFTPVFFEVNEVTYVYKRTELYIIPNIIVFFYLVYNTVLVYWYKNKVGKYLFLPAVIFLIPIILGSVLDFLFYGMTFKQMGIAIALTSIYVNVQKEISCIDSLSGLHTRQYMINHIAAEMNRSKSEVSLIGILLDVDKFKLINDTYGHLAGDDAIRSVGKILLNTVPKKAMAVRFAGDEFMVILKNANERDVQNLLASIYSATEEYNATQNKPYEIHFSAGYSIFDKENDTVNSFFDRMDEAMYGEKNIKLEEIIENGKYHLH